MKQQHADYQVVPYPKMRRLEAIAYRSVQHKPIIHGLLEVDVTRARSPQALAEHVAVCTVSNGVDRPMKTLERVQEPSKIPIQAPAVPPKRIMAATNVFVRFLLRSPFNFGLGNTLLLLTYTGRKSGKRYTNPLPYMREGDAVTVFTYRSWWKNVRGGAPVLVEINRRRMGGTAEAISEEKAAIAMNLLAFLRKHPALAKGYHVPLDADGQPNPEAVQQAAHFVVMVRIHLSGGPTALQPTTQQGAKEVSHAC